MARGAAQRRAARRGWILAAMLAGVSLAPGAAGAQAATASQQVLTLDWERLFDESHWGKRIREDLARESQALSQENDRIADELVAEEKSLTERRATMNAEDFRREAAAFDARATEIRNTQKAKAQALTQKFEDEREALFRAIAPLLDDILQQRGAAVVMDRRAIIRGRADADVTGALVTLVNDRFGEGPQPAATP
ncbi:OmpH family outer membrane protein [Paenirhodobacter populi]|uniref:OmpH family outer membrane protein n=1 Tax=Paenirhodobacter populi TaxID=2306993 RepID=A0A443JU02_9RHOB|nr:OmpH family outer membrane protein [Sinirhodobacter populi]RWR14821.1 OmpH family outer membrane protein [Sinirhodobacter populi]RWR23976.1 OmpH family outer membrane protein [Sinirhodobacter populi]